MQLLFNWAATHCKCLLLQGLFTTEDAEGHGGEDGKYRGGAYAGARAAAPLPFPQFPTPAFAHRRSPRAECPPCPSASSPSSVVKNVLTCTPGSRNYGRFSPKRLKNESAFHAGRVARFATCCTAAM